MKLVKAEEIKISEVIKILKNDGLIIYPTETLYGIGVRYDKKNLLRKIFEIKKRPEEKTFPLIADFKHLSLVVDFIPEAGKKLMEKYWPGPLTILLPAKKGINEELVSDGKIAIRVPGKSFALKLIKKLDFPITSTSANISGTPPAKTIQEVLNYFQNKDIDLIIDGGQLPGIPSTIVDATVYPPKILRKGAVEIDLSFD